MQPDAQQSGLNRSSDYRLWIAVSFLTVGTISTEIVPVQIAGLGVNQLLLYAISICLAVRAFFDGTARYAFVGPALVVTVIAIWSTASTLWSPVPLVSFVKGNTFILNVFVGCYVASRLDAEHILRGLCIGIMLSVLLSAALALAMPSLAGTTPFHPGAWRGLYAQKNVLGRACMLAAIFLLTLRYLETDRSRRRLIAFGILITLVVLVQSQSATSLAGVAAFLVIFPFARAAFLHDVRVRIVSLIFAIPLGVVGVIFISEIFDQILTSLGRSGDLTGRVPLWNYALYQLEARFFVGYGLDGFFQAWNEGALMSALAWVPDHAHNGFLDMALEVGTVAVAALLFALVWGFFLLPFAKGEDRYLGVLSLVVYLVIFLQNVTESNLYRSSNTIWIVFVVVLVALWMRRDVVRLRNVKSETAARSIYKLSEKRLST